MTTLHFVHDFLFCVGNIFSSVLDIYVTPEQPIRHTISPWATNWRFCNKSTQKKIWVNRTSFVLQDYRWCHYINKVGYTRDLKFPWTSHWQSGATHNVLSIRNEFAHKPPMQQIWVQWEIALEENVNCFMKWKQIVARWSKSTWSASVSYCIVVRRVEATFSVHFWQTK